MQKAKGHQRRWPRAWSPTVSNPASSGYANSSCNGSGTINAYAYGNSVSGNTTSYANCSTTYTPPTSQNIDIQKPVVFVLADRSTKKPVIRTESMPSAEITSHKPT